MLLVLALSCTGLSLLAIAVGWRGRRINDHPTCRACGYDLIGSPTAETCPECAAALNARGAVRRGAHRRSPPMLWTGILLLVLGLGAGGLWVAQRPAMLRLLPERWLLVQVERGPADHAGAAVEELTRWEAAGAVTPAWRSKAVPVAVRAVHQNNPDDVPPAMLGLLRSEILQGGLAPHDLSTVLDAAIRSAEQSGGMPAGPWGDVLKAAAPSATSAQGARIALAAVQEWKTPEPERAVAGDAIDLHRPPVPEFDRALLALVTPVTVYPEPLAAAIDGRKLELATRGGDGHLRMLRFERGAMVTSSTLRDTPPEQMPEVRPEPGRHAAVTQWRMRLWTAMDGRSPVAPDGTLNVPPAAAPEVASAHDVQVFDRLQDAVELVSPATHPDARSPILRTDRGITVGAGPQLPEGRVHYLQFSVRLNRDTTSTSGVWVAGRPAVRIGDRLIQLTPAFQLNQDFVVNPAEGGMAPFLLRAEGLPLVNRLDLVLLPDPRLALRHPEAKRVWNEPIVIEDVEVTWPAAPGAGP